MQLHYHNIKSLVGPLDQLTNMLTFFTPIQVIYINFGKTFIYRNCVFVDNSYDKKTFITIFMFLLKHSYKSQLSCLLTVNVK